MQVKKGENAKQRNVETSRKIFSVYLTYFCQVSNSLIHDDTDKLSILFALQTDRDTLVHTFCGGVHIPAVLMLQAQREQQLCRYNSSGWSL